jgi:hypothetical protein
MGKIHAVRQRGITLDPTTLCGRRLPSVKGTNAFYLFLGGDNTCRSCERFAAKLEYAGNLREVIL